MALIWGNSILHYHHTHLNSSITITASSVTFSALLLIASACLAMIRLSPASLARLHDECFAITTDCELFQKGQYIRLSRRSSASKTHEPKRPWTQNGEWTKSSREHTDRMIWSMLVKFKSLNAAMTQPTCPRHLPFQVRKHPRKRWSFMGSVLGCGDWIKWSTCD